VGSLAEFRPESGFLLLGEVHGVRENPLIIAALLREFGLTSLALEWPEGLAPVLRELAAAGPLELILIDGVMDAGWSWSQRDEAMARRVLAAPAAAVTTTSRRAGSGRAPVPVPSPQRSSSRDEDLAFILPGASEAVVPQRRGRVVLP
jgi:hypothetical protein